jgi:ankyrin repeat protein
MLVLQKVFLFSLLAVLFSQDAATSKQQLNDQLYEAVRKGDTAAVTSLLDRGADVNAKFRYGATALFKAAERGHIEIAKVLIDRGADVKVKDTFYGATAMTWALDGKHLNVVQLLLEKNADEVENVLMTGVGEGNEDFVKTALARGGAKPETLTVALVIATGEGEKGKAIAELLKKAGAVPPPDVDAATIQSYAGKYKGEPGPEFTIVAKEGVLFATGLGRGELRLMPIDATTFRPLAFPARLTFNVEGGKVTGLTFKGGENTTLMKRLEMSQ